MNILPLELLSEDSQPGMSRNVALAIGILQHHVMGPRPCGASGEEIHCQDQHVCAGNDELYRRIGSRSVLRSHPVSHISATEIYTGAVNLRPLLRGEISGFEMVSDLTTGRRVVPRIVVIPRRRSKCDAVVSRIVQAASAFLTSSGIGDLTQSPTPIAALMLASKDGLLDVRTICLLSTIHFIIAV